MRGWRLVLLAIMLVLAGWAGAARGQSGGMVGDVHVGLESLGGGPDVEGGPRAWYRRGHWVPVRVRLDNRTGKRFAGFVAAEQVDLDGDKVRCVSRQVVVEPGVAADDTDGSRDVWLYVWPRPDDDQGDSLLKAVSVLDESRTPVATLAIPWERRGRPISLEAREDRQSQRWIVVLGPKPLGWAGYEGSKQGVATNQISWLTRASMLPDSALGLDGVDVVVWEAGQEGTRLGDLGEDIRIRALLEWVKAGGHLIVTVGDHWAEVADTKSKLAEALPMTLTGARQLPDTRIIGEYLNRTLPVLGDGGIVQAIGKLRPGARAIGPQTGTAKDAPLVVTGQYGAGTVTLVTVDLAATSFDRIRPVDWVGLWQQTAGWTGIAGTAPDIMLADEFKVLQQQPDNGIPNSVATVLLDEDVSQSVDLRKQTAIRLLLAVLFLGLYWLAAGPGGYLVLRKYKVRHWSWWIFGATVLVASGVAWTVVWGLKLESYEMRHRTFVMGRVGSNQVSLLGYYGVFAPVAGSVDVRLPKATGLSYLAPLCDASMGDVQSFADPQHYDLDNALDYSSGGAGPANAGTGEGEGTIPGDRAGPLGVPFRSTLKKLQARWVGELPGRINGETVKTRVYRPTGSGELRSRVVPEGMLVNDTGYDLAGVEIIFTAPEQRGGQADVMIEVSNWPNGQSLDLAKEPVKTDSVNTILTDTGDSLAGHAKAIPGWTPPGEDTTPPPPSLGMRQREDLINVLLEARGGERVRNENQVQFRRQLTRLVDRSDALRVSKMLIIARAGDWRETGVESPIPISVNGHEQRGAGEILFTWTGEVERVEGAPK